MLSLIEKASQAFDEDEAALYRELKRQGILVRHFDKPGLADKLRITVGTAEQNDALLAALPG